jgi:hypothetical protein
MLRQARHSEQSGESSSFQKTAALSVVAVLGVRWLTYFPRKVQRLNLYTGIYTWQILIKFSLTSYKRARRSLSARSINWKKYEKFVDEPLEDFKRTFYCNWPLQVFGTEFQNGRTDRVDLPGLFKETEIVLFPVMEFDAVRVSKTSNFCKGCGDSRYTSYFVALSKLN